MTNYEKWRLLTANLASPDTYIDFGFHFLITTALQRRVWFNDENHLPLFPNLYIIFVGPPAVGKGMVLSTVAQLLRYHKYEKGLYIKTSIGPEAPLLFPIGADSITFEELMAEVAGCMRTLKTANKAYCHCSYAFVLPELSSLFKRKTEDVVKFLLNAYDCDQYEYKTKHQGKDIIRNLCFNFLAGTQLDFLRDAHKNGIFGQGLSSRTIWLFENERRFDEFFTAKPLTDAQRQAKLDLLDWIKKLSTLYGPLPISSDVEEYLKDWYVNIHCPKERIAADRMRDYLGRKKVTLLKLAAAMHFAENLTYDIPLATYQAAIAKLDAIEPTIAAGLALSGRNDLHLSARKMLSYIRQRKEVLEAELVLEFGSDLDVDEIMTCIKELEIGYNLKSGLSNGKKIYKL